MLTKTNQPKKPHTYVVVHPLHEQEELKVDIDSLPPIKLGLAARISLKALKVYFVVAATAVSYNLVKMALQHYGIKL